MGRSIFPVSFPPPPSPNKTSNLGRTCSIHTHITQASIYVICKHTVLKELPSFTQEGEEEEEGREEEGGRVEWREEGVREDLGVFCWRSCNTVRCCCFGGVGE